MIINLSLITVFFVSAFTLWYRLSQRVPELLVIPDEIISARLHESHERRRSMMISFLRALYKNKSWREIAEHFLGKALYRIHIFLLKIDNYIVPFLKKMHINGFGGMSIKIEEEKEHVAIPHAALLSETASPKSHRIQEVRLRREE